MTAFVTVTRLGVARLRCGRCGGQTMRDAAGGKREPGRVYCLLCGETRWDEPVVRDPFDRSTFPHGRSPRKGGRPRKAVAS